MISGFERRSVLAGLSLSPITAATVLSQSASGSVVDRQKMKRIQTSLLDIAYFETGPADGSPVILLHGFPYDAHAYDEAAARIASAGKRCIVPFLRGYGPTRFLRDDSFRSGQQAALGLDLHAMMDALGLRKAVLAGYDWGGRAACVVAALWPERVSGLVTCGTAYNLQNLETAREPIDPAAERRHWYWFYLNSERGVAALAGDREAFCKALWRDFSPTWSFSDEAYARTAASFDNPDFVAVVLHSYRVRIGAVTGDPVLEAMERQLAVQSKITVPTIALVGAEDGTDPPSPPDRIAPHFTDLQRQMTLPGIGHNLPQEASAVFADAVLQLDG